MMQDTTMKSTELDKAIKENPAATLLGLLAFAGMVEGIAKGKVPAPDAKKPETDAPALTATMAEFKVIEDKARTDLYALMDECFEMCLTVFFNEFPDGNGCWNDHDEKYRKTPHTIAIIRTVLGKESVGISALNPPDEFCSTIGRVIALRRAMGKTVPKEYYTAGALLARASLKPGASIAAAPLTKAFKVGDMVKLTGKTASPSISASDVTTGNTYKITRVDDGDKSIQLDGHMCGWVNPVDLEHVAAKVEKPDATIQPGDYVRMKGANFSPSTTSHAKVGGIYKVKYITATGNICLSIPVAPYVNKADVETVTFVERRAKTGEVVRIKTTGAFGADVTEGDFFKVTGHSEEGNETLGKNVNTGENGGWYMNKDFYEVVEVVNASHSSPDAPPTEKWVKKEAQVGDTIRRTPGFIFGGNVTPRKVKAIGTCSVCGARILILEDSDDTPHPGNYEVLEVEKATPDTTPEKWVRRAANVGDTIRMLTDSPEGAMTVRKGDRFKVVTSYGPHCVVTDKDGWYFADTSYEVLDV